jgi:hypothetical protein
MKRSQKEAKMKAENSRGVRLELGGRAHNLCKSKIPSDDVIINWRVEATLEVYIYICASSMTSIIFILI